MNTTATANTQIRDMADDLTGFHPLLDQAVTALAALAEADLTADQSQSLVAALGGFDDTTVATLAALVVKRIADPDTNRSLTDLPEDRKQTLRRLGSEYAAAVDNGPQPIASEISAVIDGV